MLHKLLNEINQITLFNLAVFIANPQVKKLNERIGYLIATLFGLQRCCNKIYKRAVQESPRLLNFIINMIKLIFNGCYCECKTLFANLLPMTKQIKVSFDDRVFISYKNSFQGYSCGSEMQIFNRSVRT